MVEMRKQNNYTNIYIQLWSILQIKNWYVHMKKWQKQQVWARHGGEGSLQFIVHGGARPRPCGRQLDADVIISPCITALFSRYLFI